VIAAAVGSGLLRATGEERTGQRIGLDVDHHDVLALLAAGQHMADPGCWRTGGVDHDVDVGLGDHARAVVEESH